MKILSKKEVLKNEEFKYKVKEEINNISRNWISLLFYRLNKKINSITGKKERERYLNSYVKCKFLINKNCPNSKYININGETVLSLDKTFYFASLYEEKLHIYSQLFQDIRISTLKYILDPSNYKIDINSRLYDDADVKHSSSSLKGEYKQSFDEPNIFYLNYFVDWDIRLEFCNDDFFVSYDENNDYIDELLSITLGARNKSMNNVYVETSVDKAKNAIMLPY